MLTDRSDTPEGASSPVSRLLRFVPTVLEAAGVGCIAVAGASLHDGLAWFVVGVALILKAFEVDITRARRDRGNRR